MDKLRVVFSSTVFEEVETGPGIYAQYLWDAFRDDPDIEFHVVAPFFKQAHPRLHPAAEATSGSIYHRVAHVCRQIIGDQAGRTTLHGNAAHAMGEFTRYPGPWLAQVNDYEAAEVYCRPFAIMRQHGPRRILSMVWRHHQEARVVRSATRIVSNSDFTRSRILDIYHADPQRVVTIHKAVDTSVFQRPSSLPADPFPDRPAGARLVFVGADWQRKGLAELVSALGIVAKSFPNVNLVVGGPSDHASLGEIARLAAAAGAGEHLLLAGRLSREKLIATYFHSDIFVLPSHCEALGVAILEAMAAGLAVISCPVGGIPEIIRSPAEGVLVPPQDSPALAGAIMSLLRNADERARLAQAGPQRAADFSKSLMVARIKDLYLDLAHAAGPARPGLPAACHRSPQ